MFVSVFLSFSKVDLYICVTIILVTQGYYIGPLTNIIRYFITELFLSALSVQSSLTCSIKTNSVAEHMMAKTSAPLSSSGFTCAGQGFALAILQNLCMDGSVSSLRSHLKPNAPLARPSFTM